MHMNSVEDQRQAMNCQNSKFIVSISCYRVYSRSDAAAASWPSKVRDSANEFAIEMHSAKTRQMPLHLIESSD